MTKKKSSKGRKAGGSGQRSGAPYSEFSKVLKYYSREQPFIFRRAFELFLEQLALPITPLGRELLEMVVAEWFVFDFRLPNGKTVLRDYIDRNPDRLSAQKIDDLSQAEQSNRTAEFWLNSVDREQHYLLLEDIYTGNTIQVYDVSASRTVPSDAGMIIGRVIQQDGQWYFAGNPLGLLPVTATKRLRDMMKGLEVSDEPKQEFIDFFRRLYCEHDEDGDGGDGGEGGSLPEPLSDANAKPLIEGPHGQVDLAKLAEALESPYDSPFQWYIDTETMEISFVEDEFFFLIEECLELPRDQALQKALDESSHYAIDYDRDEVVKWLDGYGDQVVYIEPVEAYEKYSIMEDFIELEVDDEQLYERLQRAIRGKGAFRRFKEALDAHGRLEDYYQFYDDRMQQLAREWLEDNGFIFL